jgi:hypothetical protein
MKLFLRVIPPLAAAALSALPFQALRAQTTVPSVLTASTSSTFGMVGIAAGETARVNALNLAAGGPIVVGGSCQVTATFLDDKGNTLLTKSQTVAQGEAAHFDMPRSEAQAGADPVEIRATVSASSLLTPGATYASLAGCSILPTMEIFDQATGRTSVVLENPRSLPTILPLAAAAR